MRSLSIALSFILLSFLTSCFSNINEADIEEMEFYQTDNYNSTDLELITSSDDAEVIEDFVGLINNSSRQSGAVDMVEPHYELILLEDGQVMHEYFVWSFEGSSASIMDKEDTHTLYSVQDDDRQKLEDFISAN